jgi:hypothetical protein
MNTKEVNRAKMPKGAKMREHKVYELNESDKIEMRMNKRFPFNKMADIIVSGGSFFIPDITAKSAGYVRRKLEAKFETFIDAALSYYTSPEGEKLEGYTFSLSLAKEYFKKVFEEKK